MSTTAIVAISRHGAALARSLAASMGGQASLHLERRFQQPGEAAAPFDLPVRPLVQQLFKEHQRLVLFMPVGAAVRLLAACLQDKHADPAVVCVDDAGRFAVSLLSGHLGGADRLAKEVAETLGATPVITSASHVMGVPAVDLLGHELGWQIEADPVQVTRASAAVVNGAPVGLYQEAGELDWLPPGQQLPDNITRYNSLQALFEASWAAALIITDRQLPLAAGTGDCPVAWKDTALVVYRPRTLAVGMGCRRGVPMEELEELLVTTFDSHGLATGSLKCIATAELKQDEPGIRELAGKYGVPVQCYSAEELNSVFGPQPAAKGGARGETPPGPTAYSMVHRLLGLWGVSEPAALLAAGSQELLVPRVKTRRATIAVARLAFGADRSQNAAERLGPVGEPK